MVSIAEDAQHITIDVEVEPQPLIYLLMDFLFNTMMIILIVMMLIELVKSIRTTKRER